MSPEQNNAIIGDKNLSPACKMVFAYLWHHRATDGLFNGPSTEIAAALGIEPTYVLKILGVLHRKGLIKKESRQGRTSIFSFPMAEATPALTPAQPLHILPGTPANIAGVEKKVFPSPLKKPPIPIQKPIIKKNTKKGQQSFTLDEWEALQGSPLRAEMMESWAKEHRISREVLAPLITEFRERLGATGKPQSDFVRTFQVYFRKGWLALSIEGAQKKTAWLLQRAAEKPVAGVTFAKPGVQL